MHRVLLIGPEKNGLGPADQAALLRLLTDSGMHALAAPLGGLAEGVDTLCYAFGGRPPHLLVVDLTAPGSVAAGTLPLRHIQRIQRDTWTNKAELLPLIALLAPGHLQHTDLSAYMDDFLLPPHAPDELIYRIRLLMFRRQQIEGNGVLRFQDVVLQTGAACALTTGGAKIPLTPREYDLLCFLLTHRGRLFSRERLLEMVWGTEYDGGSRTVDIHIRRLRAKLPPGTADRLENRRHVGYGFLSAPF